MKSGLLLTLTTATLLFASQSARAAYDFVTLVDPQDTVGDTVAAGINNSGEVVGYYSDSSLAIHGFTYSGGSYAQPLDVAGATSTTLTGVDNAGNVVGSYTSGGVSHGAYNLVGPINDTAGGTVATYTNGVNGSGTLVAGYYADSGLSTHGFISNSPTSFLNFDYPGAAATQALGVNNAGTVVGTFSDGTTPHGFVGTPGSLTQVDDPLGVNGTFVTSINDLGDFAGYYIDGGGITHAFVDVNGTYQTVDAPNAGSGGTKILGLNDNLEVVGYYVDPNGVIEGFTADVPEPGTLALFGFGALGVLVLRRRRGFGF